MGRVVTLVKTNNTEDRVYGVAYEIHSDDMEKTFEHLNFREKCGYSLNEVTFYPDDCSAQNGVLYNCLCYFANEGNVYYSPSDDLGQISTQIFHTVGPSGTNKEYLYNLCNTLRIFAQNKAEHEAKYILEHDKHLFELEELVKKNE